MKVGRSFLIYLSSSLVAGMLPLLLMPFLTRHLTPEEYGIMVTVTTLVMVTLPLIQWGSISYLGVQYFRSPFAEFVDLYSTILVVPVVATLLFVALFAFVADPIAALLDVPTTWVPLLPVMAAAFYIPMSTLNLLRMRDCPFSYGVVELVSTSLNFSLTLWLVLAVGLTWEGRVLGIFGANLMITIAAVVWLLRRQFITCTFTRSLLPRALHYGSGVVPHEIANQSMRLADRLIIAVVVGQTALGAYGVATQIATVMLVMLTALNRAWTPFVFSSLKEDSHQARIRLVKRSYQVQIGLLIFFALFNLAVPVMYDQLVDSRYHESQSSVFWLSLSYLFNGFYLTVVDRIFYLRKTHLLAKITILNAIGSLSLAFTLAGTMGALGVPIAFAIISGVVAVMTFILAQRLSPLPWLGALQP
jgi:O-antigen/teichoic acid export membrane protein